ncbi:leucine-rich repeat domain-containing protein [Treponema phagedenis]|uniref:leucine-rich repeat domain-containing protein n=1 Tax=Treponema phagedenis TaxID=162 RepID=UPI002090ED04|nr:leucine-rich repeat domain-containing protein [Treponema phagedenis]
MDKIRMRTNAGSIKLRVTTKDGSPCELWNGGKKIAELQSDNWENIAVQNNAEEIIIKGYDIQELGCDNNQLTALNASGCTRLQVLYCSYNQLTTLNVNGCTSLQWLDCSNNQLTTLNASGCTSLQVLYCYYNQLTALNVSGLTSLQHLDCYNNKLSAEVFKKIFEDLPERKEKCGRVLLYKDGDSNYKDFTQPPELAAAFKAAKAKGWRLYKINNDDLMEL